MDDDRTKKYVDDSTLRFIQYKARQLAGRYGFGPDEVEDIQQNLTVRCLERMRRFDSRRANPRTFARLVIHREIANIIESQKAHCRDYRLGQIPLNTPTFADAASAQELAEVRLEGAGNLEGLPRTLNWDLSVRLDVERVVATLPQDLQRICQLLMVLDRLAEVAKAAGISRATLYRRVCTVRVVFEQAGFGRRHLGDRTWSGGRHAG